MEFLLSIIQIPFLIYLIRYLQKQHSDDLHQKLYYYLLSFKVTCGFCLGVIYFHYYTYGDTIEYDFHLDYLSKLFYSDITLYLEIMMTGDLPVGVEKILTLHSQPRAFFFVRLMSPFYIFTGSNYWILSVYLSLFSFAGMWILSNTFINLFKLNRLAILLSFFIVPSVVFWSSGVMKESFVMGIMCFSISIILNITYNKSTYPIIKSGLLIFFLGILFLLKFYYFAALVGILVPYCIVKRMSYKIEIIKDHKLLRILSLILLIIFTGFLASFSHTQLNIDRITYSLYINYISTLEASHNINVFFFEGLNTEFYSFLPHIPKALVYGLFGPFLWHCKKIITLLSGIENILILILFVVFVLTNVKKKKLRRIDIEEISVILYVSILAICMAFASPNWGSLVRYKIGYLPFFLILILNNNPFIHQLEATFNFLKPSDKKE
jgi:hypothetical protein